MTARHFRKKPITVEAMQLEEGNVQEIIKWMDTPTVGWQTNPPTVWIDTLEGRMTAKDGDWIVKGIEGGFIAMSDYVFVRTYQEI